MAKPNKQSRQPQGSSTPVALANGVKFQICSKFEETSSRLSSDHRNKFIEFLRSKKEDKLKPFGSSDKAFSPEGQFSRHVPGLKHAHITHDLSIFYTLSGANPSIIRLYGFFTHDDSGTGQPPAIQRQKTLAKSLSNQDFKDMA